MPLRASGVLLHPTSLPGPYGVGDMGAEAARFIDTLAAAGVAVWQMLPVTAPGAFESPYDCRSAFAGNWLLISLDELAAQGFLPEPPAPPAFPAAPADLPAAREYKGKALRASWRMFQQHATRQARTELEAFLEGDAQAYWLDDWILFTALDSHLRTPWPEWPEPLRRREPGALAEARRELADEIGYQGYLQFLFFRQFESLRAHADRRGVRLCGDLPMYVSHQSADAWAHPQLFALDEGGRPKRLAGVPPDAFSATGQLWGSPVYDWRRHREEGFAWWRERTRAQARLVDLLRLDHFRGFVAYFEIPSTARDAREGRWARGPGRRLFAALASTDGLELFAEDLGLITPAVRKLRRQFDLPGMRVLQFGFDTLDSDHLPHHYERRSVAYSGTHDNDTLMSWYGALDGDARQRLLDYLGIGAPTPDPEVCWRLICLVLQSVAELAILPAQDLLGLGGDARMNTPGTSHDNWRWRLLPGAFDDARVERLRRLLEVSGRLSRAATPQTEASPTETPAASD